MCKKAARQLAVLKRIGHLLTIKGKLAIFNSFIESNFNYCPLIWHFCSQTNTKKIEKIQERALRFIYNNYSSTHNDLLKTAGTQYLHIKRLKHMACEVFKIVNNMSPSFITNLIEIKTSKYSMRRTKPAVVPKYKTSKYGLKSFAHEGDGYGTVYRMNYDGVTTLGNFVDCSDAGTVPCVAARLVHSR